jgi:hypothetical protein
MLEFGVDRLDGQGCLRTLTASTGESILLLSKLLSRELADFLFRSYFCTNFALFKHFI